MIYNLQCAWCNKDVMYDVPEKDIHGDKLPLHPDATRYWKADGHPDNMIEVYCNAYCSLMKHEKERSGNVK